MSAYLAFPSNQTTLGGPVGDQVQASLVFLDQDMPYVGEGSVTVDQFTVDSIPASVLP
jgi:hypothetical protein